MRKFVFCFILAALFFIQLIVSSPILGSETSQTVVTSSTKIRPNNHSYQPSVSADGRFVAFQSNASNLVPDDTNSRPDVFVYDCQNKVIERVSISSTGIQGNGYSCQPSISFDGRFVAFRSAASNLVAGDTNRTYDIFVHDRLNHTTERASISSNGIQGNYESNQPSISADGRFVAFRSASSNLVAGDNNKGYDIFVHDRLNHTTEMVTISTTGNQQNSQSYEPSISSDGRFVAFRSWANNLVPGDTNKVYDIFVHDRLNHTTERVSVSSNGGQGNGWSHLPAISSDGRYVAFHSSANNLVSGDNNAWTDIFVRDRLTKETERISITGGGVLRNTNKFHPAPISADGRYVTFHSAASDLVPDDTNGKADVFIYDRQDSSIKMASVSSTGTQGNRESEQPSITTDGRFVVFQSPANNLALDDFGWLSDIFIFDIATSVIERISAPANATPEINRTINPMSIPLYNYWSLASTSTVNSWSYLSTTTASSWPYTWPYLPYPVMDYWYQPGTSTTRILTPMDMLSLYSTGSSW